MCDLGSVRSVVHEEEFNVSRVVDQESLVAGWHHVSCLLVRAVADLRDSLLVDFWQRLSHLFADRA